MYWGFEKAREWVHAYAPQRGLTTQEKWNFWSANSGMRPAEIPGSPHKAYKDAGWRGYRDWLGVLAPQVCAPRARGRR
jgi:hypothetical protein